ncbi:Hcp family type VI secretion system effector [Cohnella cholangitidis]|uniref:Type VI secretion system tube protein Hcp n=1 Tax=Cohnella cholangitidis TaxID=2598458 RepID=A0A7G5C0K4_9BACL|nr:type VI secretion system tube protein Hcp [Cohnella cholangitidis]QMV42738.1 type VI secretion system tube protein Hcp [Cohnella cholangitidis]
MRKLRIKLIVIIGLFMMISGVASAAVSSSDAPPPLSHDAYLRLDGIAGDSKARHYENWIVLSGVQFEVSNNAKAANGGGSGSGRAAVDSFTVTKNLDAASTPLLQAALSGTNIKSGQFVLTTRGEAPSTVLTIDLNAVNVTGYEFNNEQETIRLTFNAMKFSYSPSDPKGNKSSPVSASWNSK